MIKISIITVCLNAAQHLAHTIASVAQQDYAALEYIIIDGGSTDGSVEIIQQHQSYINYWHSRADHGISDAMNQGVQQATGDYLLFLHADDYLARPDSIRHLLAQLQPDTDVYTAAVLFSGQNPRVHRPRPWWPLIYLKMPACHQGIVCRRQLFAQYGGFDVHLKITMDYDFLLRLYRHGVKVQRDDTVLAVMRDTGISSRRDWPSLRRRFIEEQRVHLKNSRCFWQRGLYRLYGRLYRAYRYGHYLIHS